MKVLKMLKAVYVAVVYNGYTEDEIMHLFNGED